MRRLVVLITSAAVVVVMMTTTSPAVAQGNPRVIDFVLPVPACDPGQGGTRGTDAHGVQEPEVGLGGTTCFVPLPAQALEPGEEF